MIQRFTSAHAPQAYGPYVHATLLDNLIFLSGQNGREPATAQMVGGGIRAQTERAIKNIEAILVDLGGGLSDVLRTTVFLNAMDDFNDMNEVYGALFGEDFPARSTFQVVLPFGALIAVDAIAYRRKRQP